MKKFTLVAAFLILAIHPFAGFSGTWTVASGSNDNFVPASITITAGDTVIFSLASNHNAVEVSQADWNANNNNPLSGGFSVAFGGGTVLPAKLTVGMHYYICQAHISFGMKGTINVLTSGINQLTTTESIFKAYPNPCVDKSIKVSYHVEHAAKVEINIYNLLGKVTAQVLSNIQTPGDYLIGYDIDRSRITGGIYILELMVDNKRSVQKLVIQ